MTVSVRFKDENFWMTQKAIAELFETTTANINVHIKNILDDEELDAESTIKDFLIVQTEGSRQVRRKIQFYSLDMIIAVGYRVNSKKATRFHQWATKTLHEYIQKGFVLNDELLKNGKPFGRDYFNELLARIREIRASERRAYQKIAVKGISVTGSTATEGYVYLEGINLSKGNPTAAIEFDVKGANGVRKARRIVNEGYNLFPNSGEMDEYKNDYTVLRIDGRDSSVEFINGIKLFAGDVLGAVSEEQLRRIQIRETILTISSGSGSCSIKASRCYLFSSSTRWRSTSSTMLQVRHSTALTPICSRKSINKSSEISNLK